MEQNEWSFCSMWAEREKAGCAEALVNEKLNGDYFFNRAKVSGCLDFSEATKQVAEIFWRKDLDCYLYDREKLIEKKNFLKLIPCMS